MALSRLQIALGTVIAASLALATNAHAQTIRSGSGATPADIVSVMTSFRSDLGVLNPNVAGPLGPGRREINWDGVPASTAAPNLLPSNFFNATSPRGVLFSTPGTGLMVSASASDGSGVAANFGNLNSAYSSAFAPFSASRMFTPVGSNITDIAFVIPGTLTSALVRGFGAVFVGVNDADSSKIEYFNAANTLLFTVNVPAASASAQGFSFAGAAFTSDLVARVRITTGTVAPGSSSSGLFGLPTSDVVFLDDFLYAEPVPAPASLSVLILGTLAASRRRRA